MVDCFIWGTPATHPQDSSGDRAFLDSPRAGGKYQTTGTAEAIINTLENHQKARLTTWLCDQRAAGVEYPIITDQIIQGARYSKAMTTSRRIERVLLFFNRHIRIGETVTIFHDDDFVTGDKAGGYELGAVSESISKPDLMSLLQLMEKMGLIEDTTQAMGLARYTPSPSGWLQIEQLEAMLPNTTQAFVAMWFNDAMNQAYEQGIALAIQDAGYEPVRIDKKEHNNKIDDEIIAEIRRSKFLVADFTCEKDKVRGGVYFEAGFAMGLGIPVIWTCAESSFNDLHFDTRQYSHVGWKTPQELRERLRARIGAVIGDGQLKTKSG